jgi:hypothetical protein
LKRVLLEIDRLLRGAYTKPEDLRGGELRMSLRDLVFAGLGLGAAYGVFMGLYGATRPTHASIAQLGASIVKVPALFLLTLGVTLPSLYVFSALHGSALRLRQTVRLLMAAIVVNLAVLASFGPVTGFFTFSTDSYLFMVLLNVAMFAVGGAIGVGFLRKALDAVFTEEPPRASTPPAISSPATPSESVLATDAPVGTAFGSSFEGALPSLGAPHVTGGPAMPLMPPMRPYRPPPPPTPLERSRRIFRVWIAIFAVVGAQMSWILRPFIGDPDRDFTLFRERDSNFFEAVIRSLGGLFR